jgi:hypothetical protein
MDFFFSSSLFAPAFSTLTHLRGMGRDNVEGVNTRTSKERASQLCLNEETARTCTAHAPRTTGKKLIVK